MNFATTTLSEKKHFSDRVFQAFFLKKSSENSVVLAILPFILLLFNIGISFLNPCFFTLYFPFIVIAVGILTLRFKTLGLAVSYIGLFLFIAIFYADLQRQDQLWQMSILFTLALNIFILLLSIEEIEMSLKEIDSQAKARKMLIQKMELEHQLAQKASEEIEHELKEELEQLKQEAELRRIEKIKEERYLSLVQSEIDLLNSQKDAFIEDSRQARLTAALQLQQFKENEAVWQNELACCQKTLHDLQSEKDAVMLKLTQLQENEVSLRQGLLASQEALCILQQSPSQPSLSIQDQELKNELANAKGIAKQLRAQFEEKSHVLSQTRKELFCVEGKLLAIEKEQGLTLINPDRKESIYLEKEINTLTLELDHLEKEIIQLEELISRILCQ